MALGQPALALCALRGFLGGFLVLLSLAGVKVRLLAVAPGLFAQALPFPFALDLALARGHYGQDEEDHDYDDDGDDQSRGHSFFFTRPAIGKPPRSG